VPRDDHCERPSLQDPELGLQGPSSRGSEESRSQAAPAYPDPLRLRDALQIAVSALMPLLGVIILARLALLGQSPASLPMAYLAGLGFVALGLYRLKHVLRYLRWRRHSPCPPPK